MIIDDLPSYKPPFRSFISGNVAPQALLMENPGLQLPPLPPKAVDRWEKIVQGEFHLQNDDFSEKYGRFHHGKSIRTLFFLTFYIADISPLFAGWEEHFFSECFSRFIIFLHIDLAYISPVWWVEHVFFFSGMF